MNQSTETVAIEVDQTLDTLLHQILNQALVKVGADGGSLMLVDNFQDVLQIKARLGPPRRDRKSEVVFKIGGPGIASRVATTKTSYLCPDVAKDPVFVPGRSGMYFRSLLSVPILHDDRVVAVINADSSEPCYFKEEHQEDLEAVARYVARPIADRISLLDALRQVGLELARLPRDGGVEHVLERISELAVQSLGANVVTLYQYVQERDEFSVESTGPAIGGSIQDQKPMRRKVFPGDVPWTIVHDRKPGFYTDVHAQEFLTREVNRPGDPPRPRFVDRENIQSMAALLLPFRAAMDPNEEVVGAMFASYRTRHEFSLDERLALSTFADFAAAAIQNARQQEHRRTNQLRNVNTIMADLAHRMGRLATAGRAAAQDLEDKIPLTDEKARDRLKIIDQEAQSLFQLTSRLVDRLREDIERVEVIDLAELLADLPSQETWDGHDYMVVKEIPPGLPKVSSNAFQLRQLFEDLKRNAFEAMADSPSGCVTIRAQHNPITNRVEVTVSDSGCGIPEKLRDRLFSLGSSTKMGRLGIGLWWCKGFMRGRGGDITLKSTSPAEGTTFLVEIACPTQDRHASRTATPAPGDILIAEDDETFRSILHDAIADQGYSIVVVGSYTHAKKILSRESFRVAILDVNFNDNDNNNVDGLRLLDEIERSGANTKVILITGYPVDDRMRAAQQKPNVLELITKQEYNKRDFIKVVQDALTEPEAS